MSEMYTYAVARIRALEVSLFSNAVIEQLIACQSYEQCIQFLAERGWGDNDTSADAERMLKKRGREDMAGYEGTFHRYEKI